MINYSNRKMVVALDNGKHFILSPTNRLYQHCLNYLEAIPIPVDPKGFVNLDYFFTLPEEIFKYQSLEESTTYIKFVLRDLSNEINEMDLIWWNTGEWKYKTVYNSRIDKFIVLVVGLCFLGRIDLVEEEEKSLEKDRDEYTDPDNWYTKENNVYQYLLEIVQIERKRWLKILNAKQRHKLQGLLFK